MILASLNESARYEALHPLFKQLFAYVRTHDMNNVPTGRITLDGERLFINVVDANLTAQESQKLEVHRQYIDVHFPLSGTEMCGWTPLEKLGKSDAPFNEEADFAVYSQPAETYFTAQPGEFYIVWPEDAHAPAIGTGSLRKLIAKVLID